MLLEQLLEDSIMSRSILKKRAVESEPPEEPEEKQENKTAGPGSWTPPAATADERSHVHGKSCP